MNKTKKYILPLILILVISGLMFFVSKDLKKQKQEDVKVGAGAGAYYWVGGTGTWSDATNHWATSTGGLPNTANLPGTTDDVYFDSNSATTSYTVTIDATTKLMKNISIAHPSSGTTTIAGSQAMTISGNMTITMPGVETSYTGTMTFNATTTGKTVTTGGLILNNPITFQGSGGVWTLQDDLNIGINNLSLFQGTLDTNSKTVTCNLFNANAGTPLTLTLGGSTINILRDTGNAWLIAGADASHILNAGTSTIKYKAALTGTITMVGNGHTYYNIWNNTTNAFALTLTGSNVFNDIKLDSGRTMLFTANSTTTVSSMTLATVSSATTTIGSVTAAVHRLVKTGGGTISGDYLSISYSSASPGTTWYAGTHSTDGGNNSGWIFTDPPGGGTTTPNTYFKGSTIIFE